MATHAPITGAPTRAPFIPSPPAAITRVLSRFDRDALAGFIAVAIDLLDVADGDADVEENGDELDGCPNGEDEFVSHPGDGPGCTVADSATDAAWIERVDQGKRALPRMSASQVQCPVVGDAIGVTEDIEDDDPREDDDPDQCLAGDDGTAPHMTFYGLRWGSHEDDDGLEPNMVPPEWGGATPVADNDIVAAWLS